MCLLCFLLLVRMFLFCLERHFPSRRSEQSSVTLGCHLLPAVFKYQELCLLLDMKQTRYGPDLWCEGSAIDSPKNGWVEATGYDKSTQEKHIIR